MEQLIKRLPYLIYVSPLVWGIGILLFLNWTSPLLLGPAGILLVFILFYALCSSTLFALLFFCLATVNRFSKHTISQRKAYYIASVVALGPVFMVALNTLGQLGFVEVLLVIILLCVACFYVIRRSDR